MGVFNYLYILLYCLLIVLTLCTIGIWCTYAITMIKRHYIIYLKFVKKLKANPGDSNYFQILTNIHVHYSDLIKFVFFLAIGVIGGVGITLVWVYRLIPCSDLTLKSSGDNLTEIIDICETKNKDVYIEKSNFKLYGLSEVLTTIPYCCFILTVALCISLMKLITRHVMHSNGWFGVTRRSYYKWIIITFVLNCIVLILTFIPYTRLFIRPIALTLSILYLLGIYISTRNLRKALILYASKRLTQFGQNTKERTQVKLFTLTSAIVLTVYSFLTVAMVVNESQFYLVSILYFGKCYIPLLYKKTYTPLITTQQQQLTLFKFNYYLSIVNRVFSVLCATLILTILFMITFLMVVMLLKQLISRKKENKYNASGLDQKLLPKE